MGRADGRIGQATRHADEAALVAGELGLALRGVRIEDPADCGRLQREGLAVVVEAVVDPNEPNRWATFRGGSATCR
jgi:hypothetical protein